MRRFSHLLFICLGLICLAATAHAQASGGNAYQTLWSALDPGDDWSARALRSIFPIGAGTSLQGIGAESTVIGKMLGQLSGYLMALAAAFIAYSTIIQIHRAAETGQVLSNTTSSWTPIRLAFALSLMFPLPSGFSSGQALVMKVAMTGIGMARSVYTNAIKAVGPDAVPIVMPMIPGTKGIVVALMENELCRSLINAASGNPNMVPAPVPMKNTEGGHSQLSGAYTSWNYGFGPGNETGSPVCGSVVLRQADPNATNLAGVSADMSTAQMTALTSVIQHDIRADADTIAQNFWNTRQVNSLNPLMTTMINATQDYTAQLTQSATNFTSALRASLSNADDARGGKLGVAANQQQMQAVGWTGAANYYFEIARLNGQMLSLLSATPTVQPPTYEGLGWSLSRDMAPLIKSIMAYQAKLKAYVDTTDGTDAPGGNAELFSGATPGENGSATIDQVIRSIHLNERLLNAIVGIISPTTGTGWTDPFASLINLGQTLVLISLSALGLAAILASTTATAGIMAWNVLTLNFSAMAATAAGHLVMTFLGVPIFYGLMAILIPGLLIAYVLPMVPFAMWIAGVAGWFVLVIEAMIAVPLWAFAHLTFHGEGLHGRGIEGYGLLFNVLVRPVLMLFGLFMGYFVFSTMSWLMLQGFGIAAAFALSNGWFVTNLLGLVMLLAMFVLMEITLALLSFRLIALVPHHVVKMIGFAPANRVDIERFAQDTSMVGMGATLTSIKGAQQSMLETSRNARRSAQRQIGGPGGAPSEGDKPSSRQTGTDSTLNAQSDVSPPAQEE